MPGSLGPVVRNEPDRAIFGRTKEFSADHDGDASHGASWVRQASPASVPASCANQIDYQPTWLGLARHHRRLTRASPRRQASDWCSVAGPSCWRGASCQQGMRRDGQHSAGGRTSASFSKHGRLGGRLRRRRWFWPLRGAIWSGPFRYRSPCHRAGIDGGCSGP